jgi:hypothetical protein
MITARTSERMTMGAADARAAREARLPRLAPRLDEPPAAARHDHGADGHARGGALRQAGPPGKAAERGPNCAVSVPGSSCPP